MLSVDNQLAWMPSTLGTNNASPQPPREVAFNAPKSEGGDGNLTLFGDDGFSFADLIDVVNPLQHIPFVSTYYREMSGDEIAAAPRVMGSTLFFGPIGLAGALANVFVESSTGKDIGEHMASWVSPDEAEQAPDRATGTALAASSTTAAEPQDPVLAWARNETDWSKQQARIRDQENEKAKKPAATDAPAVPTDGDTAIPDASPLLRDAQPAPPPQAPTGIAQLAVLSNDIRSATRAYAVAANLRPAG